MANAALELTRMGGRANADVGQNMTATDVDNVGGIALQTICALLSFMFFDDDAGVPLSGFPRPVLTTDHCKVTATGNLSFSVSTGVGFFYNSAASTDEFGPARYLPVVLGSAQTSALGAHHATLPRIDLVCIAPEFAEDQTVSRNVKNPGTGNVTSESVAQRWRLSAQLQVVAGTANASPVPPAVPAGYMEIGRAAVPATAGAAVWEDSRSIVQLGNYLKGLPEHASAYYIPLGGASELQVTADSPASLFMQVNRGRAVIGGIMRYYPTQEVELTPGHATLGRFDRIVARANGTITAEAGTPGGGTPPATPATAVSLATIKVAPTDTTISSGDIVDTRPREPFTGTEHLQVRSTGHDRLSTQTVKLEVSAAAPVTRVSTVTVTATYPDGSALPSTALGAADYGAAIVFGVEIYLTDTSTTSDYGVTSFDTLTYFQPDEIADGLLDYGFTPEGSNILIAGGVGTPDIILGTSAFFTILDPALPATFKLRERDAAVDPRTLLIRVFPVDTPGAGGTDTVVFP